MCALADSGVYTEAGNNAPARTTRIHRARDVSQLGFLMPPRRIMYNRGRRTDGQRDPTRVGIDWEEKWSETFPTSNRRTSRTYGAFICCEGVGRLLPQPADAFPEHYERSSTIPIRCFRRSRRIRRFILHSDKDSFGRAQVPDRLTTSPDGTLPLWTASDGGVLNELQPVSFVGIPRPGRNRRGESPTIEVNYVAARIHQVTM